ncbi:MAG: hypothetical protein ACXWV4_11235 [Flavitalea sp.]
MKKDILYAITCLAFAIIIGGAVYEHLSVVPSWSAAPPVSLTMFQGEHGLKADIFWKLVHPVNLLLFSMLLAFHWKTSRRKNILIVLGSYIGILIITAIYFVPELLTIINTAPSTQGDLNLTARAHTWEVLSLIRLGVLVVLAIVLFVGLTKPVIVEPVTRKRKTVPVNV